MYVITDHEGVIIHISETIGYQENGNPLVDQGTLAIAEILVGGVSEDVLIPEGVEPQTHTYIDGVFDKNPAYPWPSLEENKDTKIKESKQMLSEFLSDNPLLWVDGNYYSATQEKQSLLTGQLVLYSGALAAGIPYQLSWNSTGGICTDWTYENLSALAFAIAGYVHPLVSYQQSIEVAINSCTTVEEVNAIEIDYTSV